jgi:superfamily II DNA or RNA helicase
MGKAEDHRVLGQPIKTKFNGEPRSFQADLFKRWQKSKEQGYSDWIIRAQMGSGKSFMSLQIAAELGLPFLVIVPLERLMGQWAEHITRFLGIPNGRIGRVQGDTCDYQSNPCCVGMIHSICKDKYPEAFKNKFGLIIYDEMHQLGADTFSEVGAMFPAYYRLGLTGTLTRGDGRENAFYYHLGKNILRAQGEKQPRPRVFVYKYKKSSGRIPSWATRKVQRRARIISNIAANQERNYLVADFANKLMEKGLRTLIVSERIQQLREIDLILKRKYWRGDTGLYIAETRNDIKQYLLEKAQGILATAKIIDIGVDVPDLRGLVLATPKADARQVIGRIRRKCDSAPDPVLVDIHDTAYNDAIGWSKKRMKYYQDEKFPVKEIEG